MSGHRWKTRSSYQRSIDVTGSLPTGKKRVLVIRIGRLGDTILATPVIGALQSYFSEEVMIDFVTSPGASARILSLDTRVNRVFPVAHRRMPWRLESGKRDLEKHSRKQPYDMVINLECGPECDDFASFVNCHEFIGRPHVKPRHRPDRHCVDTEKTIYENLLGKQATAAIETSLQLPDKVRDLSLPADEKFVVLNPGFSGVNESGYRSHRGWPERHWLTLIGLIREATGLPVLINGTADEAQYFQALLRVNGAHSLFGSDLETLALTLRNARCLITVDTGTMHLAAALGTPVIALFGPGNPLLTGPYSTSGLHRILTSGVDCQPCVKTPEQKKCSFNRCMTELEPEKVYENCEQLIGSG